MKKIAAVFFWALMGSLLNLGAMLLVQDVLCLPLFMDTMFTAAFTFFGGLPCGIATAVVTHLVINPLMSTYLPNYLYSLCSVAVVLITAFFIRLFPEECSAGKGSRAWGNPRCGDSGIFDCIAVLFVLSLVMCVALSLLGGIISTILETFFTTLSAHDATIFIFRRILVRKFGGSWTGPALLAVEVLCRVPVNILDRFISVFGGYGFARALTTLTARIGHGEKTVKSND
ncbi:MAG: hypothetical protein LBP32_01875 [Spirochaetaceae bacterium]|jgi:hypothetical protein|nr:hypothetical protein [Spirochaetaceae bacterium]